MADYVKRSIRPNPNGDMPQIDSTAYIDPSAQVIGNVTIGPEVFVGPNAVIRSDEADGSGQVQAIVIEAQCNVQDGVILHALGGTGITVGPRTSLAHDCVIHGPCTIGGHCFIGFKAGIYKSVLASGVLIGTATVVQGVEVSQDTVIPPATVIVSAQDLVDKTVTMTPEDREFMERIVNTNIDLVKGYKGLKMP